MTKINEILKTQEELDRMVSFYSKSDFGLNKFDSMFTYLDMLKRHITDFNYVQKGMNLYIDFGKAEEQNYSIEKIKEFIKKYGLTEKVKECV